MISLSPFCEHRDRDSEFKYHAQSFLASINGYRSKPIGSKDLANSVQNAARPGRVSELRATSKNSYNPSTSALRAPRPARVALVTSVRRHGRFPGAGASQVPASLAVAVPTAFGDCVLALSGEVSGVGLPEGLDRVGPPAHPHAL